MHPKNFCVCSVIFWTKMMHLQLGISAKVSILVSRLHPKNLISKAYANYTKTDKAEGLVVVSEGPKSIHHEEKVVVVFCHPPKGDLTKESECWAIEGKDSPSEIMPKYNNQGKTVGLLLHVLEPIFTRGNVVILDSGFCVVK